VARGPARPLALLLAAISLLTSACAASDDVPEELVDGTAARRTSIAFEGVQPPVIWSVTRLVGAVRTDPASRVGSCLRQDWTDRPSGPVVHRIGIFGESVTFSNASRTGLFACDAGGDPHQGTRSWCGHAFGRLTRGLLRDPRLIVGACSTSDRRPLAFAWLSPGPGTHFVVLDHDRFAEAYEVAAGLPIRVATADGIDTPRSSATFQVSEHRSDGRVLRAYALPVRVAG
jgi:hypothetical protein